jgi:hypothetical protein
VNRRRARFAGIVPLVLLAASCAALNARAEEASGCDKFKWPVARQQAALLAEARPAVGDGGGLALGTAVIVHLAPVDKVAYAQPPERAPLPGGFGAVLTLADPPAGVYSLSLSAGAWIDVLQDGAAKKPLAFSGAKDCPGIHKILKFQLDTRKTVIQISNARDPQLSIVVLPE